MNSKQTEERMGNPMENRADTRALDRRTKVQRTNVRPTKVRPTKVRPTKVAAHVVALMAAAALLGGCETVKNVTGQGSSSAPAPAPAPAPAAPAPAAAAPAGDTQHVKGINDWEGDIVGKPAANSRFTKLTIGMGMRQVTDLVGQPTDQGAYITGKAFIPFFFGSDRYRHELVYKGQGRLIFAGGSRGDYSSGNLIEIVHNANEGGYR